MFWNFISCKLFLLKPKLFDDCLFWGAIKQTHPLSLSSLTSLKRRERERVQRSRRVNYEWTTSRARGKTDLISCARSVRVLHHTHGAVNIWIILACGGGGREVSKGHRAERLGIWRRLKRSCQMETRYDLCVYAPARAIIPTRLAWLCRMRERVRVRLQMPSQKALWLIYATAGADTKGMWNSLYLCAELIWSDAISDYFQS